jgi:hypothetical protein
MTVIKLPKHIRERRYWPKDLSDGAKLQRFQLLLPDEFRAMMRLVDERLKRYYVDRRHHPPKP